MKTDKILEYGFLSFFFLLLFPSHQLATNVYIDEFVYGCVLRSFPSN